MKYKVCILAAGIGSRMDALSNHINKAVLPVNFKAVISHIIEKFDNDVEIVVAVGHKKETIQEYLDLAYPERKITYIEVDRYMGPGTGPGYSLLQCKNHLQCPFIFYASDTLVLEKVPEPDHNWFGIAPVKETEQYCTVKIKNNLVSQLDDKIKTNNKFAFIGLAGIHDHEHFFDALEKDKEIKGGEIQVSNGFNRLIGEKLVPIGFTWFDTGTLDNYKETNESFSGGNVKFDFSKGDEFIYFVNGKVIKYFADREIVDNRHQRAIHLKGLCPEIENKKGNFYSYKKIDGQVLYDVLNRQLVRDFLRWSRTNLWKQINLSEEEQKKFNEACKKFYFEKTMSRIKKFYEKTNIDDEWSNINGIQVPPLKELLEKVDWELVTRGVPTNFHGDLQFDNVLTTRDTQSNLQKFILLDWRQDFGGLVEHGDLYYDLAKLYGGVTLSYQLIKKGEFSFDISGNSVYYNFSVNNDLIEAKEEYESFLNKQGFDLMLYYMGKSKLYQALKDLGKYNSQ
jgi:NDP-sugar pyrophosphorylase family protein